MRADNFLRTALTVASSVGFGRNLSRISRNLALPNAHSTQVQSMNKWTMPSFVDKDKPMKPKISSEELHRFFDEGEFENFRNVFDGYDVVDAINDFDEDGKTLLGKAVEGGHGNIVKFLSSKKGIDVNKPNRDSNQTPLAVAIDSGHEWIEYYLRSSGGVDGGREPHKPSMPSFVGRNVPMKPKISSGWIHYYLDRADLDGFYRICDRYDVSDIINDFDRDGKTPLNKMIERGYDDIAKRLVNKGADVNRPNKGEDQTPAAIAVGVGNKKMAAYLLLRGGEGVDIVPTKSPKSPAGDRLENEVDKSRFE